MKIQELLEAKSVIQPEVAKFIKKWRSKGDHLRTGIGGITTLRFNDLKIADEVLKDAKASRVRIVKSDWSKEHNFATLQILPGLLP